MTFSVSVVALLGKLWRSPA